MPGEIDVWSGRIKAVEREFYAARFAIDQTLTQVKADNSILTDGLELREIVRAAKMLEGTYIMRLFAEFESAVRLYFRLARKRRPPSKTEDLLNSVASRRGIPHEQLKNAHKLGSTATISCTSGIGISSRWKSKTPEATCAITSASCRGIGDEMEA
jgi:hypothetical protein